MDIWGTTWGAQTKRPTSVERKSHSQNPYPGLNHFLDRIFQDFMFSMTRKLVLDFPEPFDLTSSAVFWSDGRSTGENQWYVWHHQPCRKARSTGGWTWQTSTGSAETLRLTLREEEDSFLGLDWLSQLRQSHESANQGAADFTSKSRFVGQSLCEWVSEETLHSFSRRWHCTTDPMVKHLNPGGNTQRKWCHQWK